MSTIKDKVIAGASILIILLSIFWIIDILLKAPIVGQISAGAIAIRSESLKDQALLDQKASFYK